MITERAELEHPALALAASSREVGDFFLDFFTLSHWLGHSLLSQQAYSKVHAQSSRSPRKLVRCASTLPHTYLRAAETGKQ